jgi:outer membrane protein assembly factor BamB
MKNSRAFAACLLLGAAPFAVATAHAKGSSDAVAYQVDIAHSGQATLKGFKGKLKPLWTKNLGYGAISYPLIADGMVFVTAANTSGYGTQLFALDAASGATVWQQALSGTYFWSNAAYDKGQIFAVNYDGLVRAFDAASGTLNWSAQMQTQYSFSSPPTASKGKIWFGGSGEGGTLYAVDEKNGNVAWSEGVENGSNSAPALGDGGVFVTYPCQYYGFAPKSGGTLWHDSDGCQGGGGKTPVYFNGGVYVRDPGIGYVVLDAKSGAQSGSFLAGPAPAFFMLNKQPYGAALANGALTAFNTQTNATLWSFTGDGQLSTAPLTIGSYVVEGSTSGNLYVLNGENGKLATQVNVGAGIPGPDEQNVSQPLTGLAAADGILVVPAGSQLSAYAPK